MPKKLTEKRVRYDWEAIWSDYRAGIISIREISRKHKVDHGYLIRKAKKLKIERDLTKKIKQAAKIKLVTKSVTTKKSPQKKVTTPLADDQDIINEKADELVAVQLSHRKDIKRSKSAVMILQDQLMEAISTRLELEKTIEVETKEDDKRRGMLMKAVSLPSHSLVAKNLAVALKNLIGLERQAFSLDDAGDDLDDLKSTLTPEEKKLFRKAAKIVSQRVIEQAHE